MDKQGTCQELGRGAALGSASDSLSAGVEYSKYSWMVSVGKAWTPRQTRCRSTVPSSGEDRRNTMCSKNNKDTETEQDGYGGVPWMCAPAVCSVAPRRETSWYWSQPFLNKQGPHNIDHARPGKYSGENKRTIGWPKVNEWINELMD